MTLSLDEELEFVELAERLIEDSRVKHRRLLLLSFLLLGAGVIILLAVFRFDWSSFFAGTGYIVMLSGVILNASEVGDIRGRRLADRLVRDGFTRAEPRRPELPPSAGDRPLPVPERAGVVQAFRRAGSAWRRSRARRRAARRREIRRWALRRITMRPR
jgi:hypothetical protein